jgi:5-(carboxyamino)imidazole ribonucleotide synthase
VPHKQCSPSGFPSGLTSGFPSGFPVVGMVGAGQLARMTQPAAVALGVRLRVLADHPDDSAAQVVPDASIGDHRDPAAVSAFAKGCDVLTFDHEQVPPALLEELAADGVVLRPGPAALVHAQDKAVMRRRLSDLGVPVPRWTMVHDEAELAAFADLVGWPVVLKTPRGGYDGKGVLVADSPAGAADWLARCGREGPVTGLLAEEQVAFSRELGVLVARSAMGQAAAWPVVESVQVDGVCREVIAPAPGLDPELAVRATRVGLQIAGALGVVGVLAVELFQTAPGDVGHDAGFVVNELAMRPHNTGHWTIDGAITSQFEQHLRAVLDLPLGDPRPRQPWAVMVNVLGGDHPDLYRSYLHVMARDPGVKVHLYGKSVRPGRKVGHVTVCGDDLETCRARARHAADFIAGVIDGDAG